MSFEEEFFGPGNKLRWSAIQAGTLSAETRNKLGAFIDDLRRNPEVLVLPRVDESDGRVEWYVLCSSGRFARAARDEVRAFLGSTYSDFEGSDASLDANDPVDAAVLSRCGAAAFKLLIPEPTLLNEARRRLRLMMDLRADRPVRFARQARATGRVLRDFEYALIARDASAARGCIEELRSSGRLGATNALFMEVRVLAALEQWNALFAMAGFDALLAMSRPKRVTESLLRAVYAVRLKPLEAEADAPKAMRVFRDELLPRYRDILRTKAGLAGYEIDLAFLFSSLASEPPDRARAEAIVADYDGDPRAGFLRALLATAPRAERPRGEPLQEALAAFATAEVDRAYEIALTLPQSFERAVLLLRSAREMGSLASATSALQAVDTLTEADRLRVAQTASLSRIHSDLRQLQPREQAAVAPEPTRPPRTWLEWFRRLAEPTRWRAAVNVAEIGSREWDLESTASDASQVAEIADALLADRADWARTALRDSLPFLVESLLAPGVDARVKPILENLFLSIALDDQSSIPQFSVLVRVAEAIIQLGLGAAEYTETVAQLQRGLELIASPMAASPALDTLDMLVASPCANDAAPQGFVAFVTSFFTRWFRRIDPSQWALLSRLSQELGLPFTLPDVARSEPNAISPWEGLDGKRVAMYSLRESALRRAEAIIRDLSPNALVQIFSDHVGGSPSLRTAAMTADIFVVATAAAKHAATIFIDANRPRDRPTLYARGQGSASLLEALRAHLE